MGSSEINLFNAAADAPGIPMPIGMRTLDSGEWGGGGWRVEGRLWLLGNVLGDAREGWRKC